MREALGLLIAVDARANLWAAEVGKAELAPDGFLTFAIEYTECCDEVEAAWDRYRTLGIAQAHEVANTLPTFEERAARHEQLRLRSWRAQEELLRVLQGVTERIQRLIGEKPAGQPSHHQLGKSSAGLVGEADGCA
ncbi:hypothetical protein [Actinomadura sp. WAC 06369]|uniref:hypothetical protein n=1 Tax=Actinomadura sp. WAC 06369 TaxID=2203193 RepID=UPI000F787586|nr:hypothetical protein [Actinomadura sp. WAC 06369]